MHVTTRIVEYRDSDGRLSKRIIPEDAPDEQAEFGIVIGPPPLIGLDLPLQTEVNLNNELYHRGLLTEAEIRRNRREVLAAMHSALRLDMETLLAALQEMRNGAP